MFSHVFVWHKMMAARMKVTPLPAAASNNIAHWETSVLSEA